MDGNAVLKKIAFNSVMMIVGGAALTLIGLAMFMGSVIVAIILLLCGGLLVYFGIRNKKDPYRSDPLKKNPDLLAMADELASATIYEDKFICMSERLIRSKKDPLHISFFEEIYCMYIRKESTNFIPTGKDIMLLTPRGDIRISIYGQRKAIADIIAETILQRAPYCRVGYTNENLAYAESMINNWKSQRTYAANNVNM